MNRLLTSLLVLSLGSLAWGQPAEGPSLSPSPADSALITSLVEALGGERNSTGSEASRSLAELGRAAVPSLREALRGEDGRRAERAARTLRRLGSRAASAAPDLIYVLTHSRAGQSSLASACAQALVGLGEAVVADLCRAALERPRAFQRARSIHVLRFIALRGKGEADGAVQTLTLALKDEAKASRTLSAYALKAIGAPAASAIPALVEALDDPEDSVRRAAREGLAAIAVSIEATGGWPWWHLLRVYYQDLGLLSLALLAWFLSAAERPSYRPPGTLAQVGVTLATTLPPALVIGAMVHGALRPAWVAPFLPQNPTVLPFPWAGGLSAGLLIAFPGIWICLRKEKAPTSEA